MNPPKLINRPIVEFNSKPIVYAYIYVEKMSRDIVVFHRGIGFCCGLYIYLVFRRSLAPEDFASVLQAGVFSLQPPL